MVKKIALNAKVRKSENGEANKIRKTGYLPAVLYGGGGSKENKNLKIKGIDFKKAFGIAGESTLVDLIIEGEEQVKVIIKDVQSDPVKGNIIHVDFYKVNMKEKIEVEIPLIFINEAPAVKELGGTLVKNIETVDAECLPGDLIDHLEVDISILKTFEDNFRVKHLKVPENIKVLNNEEESIVHVMETKEEIIEASVEAELPAVPGEEKEKQADGESEPEKKAEKKKEK